MALMALGELQSLQANDSSIDRLSTMHEELKKALWQTGNSHAQICVKNGKVHLGGLVILQTGRE